MALGRMKGESCHHDSDHRQPERLRGQPGCASSNSDPQGAPPTPVPSESAVSSSVEVGAEKSPSEAGLAVANKAVKKIKGENGFLVSRRLVQNHHECVADGWCAPSPK